MNYRDIRNTAVSGDALILEGRGIAGGLAIRILTGQRASHVALLVWIDEGLYVAEMVGTRGGYVLSPASERVPEMVAQGRLYYGQAPAVVRERSEQMAEKILSYRPQRDGDTTPYSWWSLVTVWISQVLRRRLPSMLVCSTLVDRVWGACGYRFVQTPDPGDVDAACQYTARVSIDAADE